jgi:hypothetical protein
VDRPLIAKLAFFELLTGNQSLDYLRQETAPAFLRVRLTGLVAQQSA